MEDGLGEFQNFILHMWEGSLNPCFSGGWSRSGKVNTFFKGALVLILVLVEDGLGANLFNALVIYLSS